MTQLHDQIQESQIAHAILGRGVNAFDNVVQAIRFEPQLAAPMEREAVRAFEELSAGGGHSLRLSFNMHDPNFDIAVRQNQARLVREVTNETRRAISNMIERGYRDGLHPYEVAKEIRAAVGLTSRQAQAVLNFHQAQLKAGVKPQVATDRAIRYAGKMRTRRAKTIATTESARAATLGRIEGWNQAAARGLFDRDTAEMEWSAVQKDPDEICGQLDGTRVPLGQTWDGLLPGTAHPLCRCSAVLRLPPPRPTLTLAR